MRGEAGGVAADDVDESAVGCVVVVGGGTTDAGSSSGGGGGGAIFGIDRAVGFVSPVGGGDAATGGVFPPVSSGLEPARTTAAGLEEAIGTTGEEVEGGVTATAGVKVAAAGEEDVAAVVG